MTEPAQRYETLPEAAMKPLSDSHSNLEYYELLFLYASRPIQENLPTPASSPPIILDPTDLPHASPLIKCIFACISGGKLGVACVVSSSILDTGVVTCFGSL